MIETVNLMSGSLDQIMQLKDSDQLSNTDIVVAEDYPLIVARGQMINGSGAPTWDGTVKSFGNTPLVLKDILTKRLKKALYFGDTSQPKFDITINQTWKKSKTLRPEIIKTLGWSLTNNDSFNLYKMFYDSNKTTFSHYEVNDAINPSDKANVQYYNLKQIKNAGFLTTTFKFPVRTGAKFIITPCEAPDWLCTEMSHDWCCPDWNNQTETYKKIYGWDDIDVSAYSSFQRDNRNTQLITCVKDGYVLITCVNGYTKDGYPLAKISFEQ